MIDPGRLMDKFLCVFTFLMIFFFPCKPLFSAGFGVYEQGSAAMGQGNAFAARANDPSAIFYNPAGISQLEGTQVSLGATAILVESEFQSDLTSNTTKMFRKTSFPPNFYVTRALPHKLTVGFGVFAPFGLKIQWPKNWELSQIIYSASLESIYFNPTIAWRPHDRLMLGFGLSYVYGITQLEKNLTPLPPPQVDLRIARGTGDGWGYNFGGILKLSQGISLALTFRSQVKIDFEGRAESVFPTFINGKVTTTITMPPMVVIGIAHVFSPKLVLEVDVQWTGWSRFQSLDLKFENPAFNTSIPRNWEDVFAFRVGGEYKINERIVLRGGYTRDETPIPAGTVDPLLPDATRDIFAVGLGYTVGFFTTDIAYNLFLMRDRGVNNVISGINQQGKYETIAHLIGLNLTFRY